jgi:hypothetical protein
MAVRACTVSFKDTRGIHGVDVEAETLYEAMVLVVKRLRDERAALDLHGVSGTSSRFWTSTGGAEDYIRFLEQMPSVRMNAHLDRQYQQNPQLPFRENDLKRFVLRGHGGCLYRRRPNRAVLRACCQRTEPRASLSVAGS